MPAALFVKGPVPVANDKRLAACADFPRPNNRTGELMTAEEFLCIVGYQSEQGGGKRPKYMNGAGGAIDAAVEESD